MVKKMDWATAAAMARVRRQERARKVREKVDDIVDGPEYMHIFDHPLEEINLTLIAVCEHQGVKFGAYEGSNGKYYSARRNDPCFCLEADAMDDAVKKGSDAIAFFLRWLQKERT